MFGNSIADQMQRIEMAKQGHAVVANLRHGFDTRIIEWGKGEGLLVLVDRAPWANPFAMATQTGIERERVLFEYRAWVQKQAHLLADAPSLKGHVLGCWCYPLPCHGDIIQALANGHDLPHGQAQYSKTPRQQSWFQDVP